MHIGHWTSINLSFWRRLLRDSSRGWTSAKLDVYRRYCCLLRFDEVSFDHYDSAGLLAKDSVIVELSNVIRA